MSWLKGSASARMAFWIAILTRSWSNSVPVIAASCAIVLMDRWRGGCSAEDFPGEEEEDIQEILSAGYTPCAGRRFLICGSAASWRERRGWRWDEHSLSPVPPAFHRLPFSFLIGPSLHHRRIPYSTASRILEKGAAAEKRSFPGTEERAVHGEMWIAISKRRLEKCEKIQARKLYRTDLRRDPELRGGPRRTACQMSWEEAFKQTFPGASDASATRGHEGQTIRNGWGEKGGSGPLGMSLSVVEAGCSDPGSW